jgi:23S rRNA (uracil1939-C5)-methyltransferase
VEVITTRMVAGGLALARADDGRVTLVDGALPEERVRVDVTVDRSDHMRARVVEVLDASPARLEPPCVHAREGCGGCGWQHITIDAQRVFKRDIIRDALRRIAHIDEPPLGETVSLPAEGYRNTVRALVVDDRPALRRHHAHDPVPIEHCLVAHPLVDDVLAAGRFAGAREVVVRAGTGTGERCAQADPLNSPIAVPDGVRTGRDAFVHELVDRKLLKVSARSFFQTRTDGAEVLVRLVRDATGTSAVVADLYCGVGLFAACLENPQRVVAVERNRTALRDAAANLRGIPAQIVRADVTAWRGHRVDVVIADPSRAGLGRDGVRCVLRCEPGRVVLVSCDAAALARDIRLLYDGGYDLVSITPVDLFPHTPHIECVTVLER